jgi:N-methylhydantoinase A
LLTTADVCATPVRTLLSGPAAGLAATLHLAQTLSLPSVIAYDMGGTSTDVALVAGGTVPLARETILDGEVIRLPQLDIHTVGAGGGSIASLDTGGSLHVGPQSASARPGPACYGHGGAHATVTDANVVLGRLGAGQELGHCLTLDAAAAEAVLARLATGAGLSTAALAEGIVALAVAKMAAAVYEISVARGYDPADSVLLCYGGAGPLHACLAAEELGIPRVIAPPNPGAFSAFGALCAALARDHARTFLAPLDADSLHAAEAFFTESAIAMLAEFRHQDIDPAGFYVERQLDLRYLGQAHELTIIIPEDADIHDVNTLFETAFMRAYGRLDRDRSLTLVNARAIGRVPVDPPGWTAPNGGRGAPLGHRPVWVRGEAVKCPVWARDDLPLGAVVPGPAIIEEMTATTFIPPDWTATCGRIGELNITRT